MTVVLAQYLQADDQRLVVKGFGLGVLSLLIQVDREVVIARGSISVVRSEGLEPDGQGLAEQGLGLGMPSLQVQAPRQVVGADRRIGVARTEQLASRMASALRWRGSASAFLACASRFAPRLPKLLAVSTCFSPSVST